MAGAGLLMLLDDIASILDDVAVLAKVAAQKTAGVLGDDLALNAEQVSGVAAERELPVIWAVAKGSLVNKLLLIPAALGISAFAPWLIIPALMLGGAYLCYEGAEKLLHALRKKHGPSAPEPKTAAAALAALENDPAAQEQRKIKGAIRTDFVLSAEIIVIALGTVPEGSSLWVRAGMLSLIGLLMTVGVYGLVAGIVKLDDAGLLLLRQSRAGSLRHRLGTALVGAAPLLMRCLTVVGTAAMFLVGGGILAHGLPHSLTHSLTWTRSLSAALETLPLAWALQALGNALLGLLAGFLLIPVLHFFGLLLQRLKKNTA